MTAQYDFPTTGVELRHLLVVSDYARSLAFYRDVLGATVVREFPGTLCLPPLWGSQILLTVPGGSTQDKPNVTFASPADADRVSSELLTTKFQDSTSLKSKNPIDSYERIQPALM
jgi:Glyoxalase/Bleomycin resistance protein/Dioxygenase superfamily